MSASIAPTAREIAGRLQLARRPRSWRGCCPACSYPDAFAVKAVPDGGARLFCANGCDRTTLDDTMRRLFAGAWRPAEPAAAPRDAKARERKRIALQRFALLLWAGCEPASGTLAERYLEARGISALAGSPALRFRADCTHPQERGRHPAMVALMQRADGAPMAVHRTYLDRHTGRKAAFPIAKATLASVWGGAIRLQAPRPGVPLVIGEGIETSASAGLLTGWPAWAAFSAGNLERGLQLPPDIRDVAIAVDPDPPGESAARGAATRWKAEGRQVRLLRPIGGGDFNDALLPSGGGSKQESAWIEENSSPVDHPEKADRPSDPRRKETALLAFRLLRMGVAGDRLLIALREQNERRADPLPVGVVTDTALWAAKQPRGSLHAG